MPPSLNTIFSECDLIKLIQNRFMKVHIDSVRLRRRRFCFGGITLGKATLL